MTHWQTGRYFFLFGITILFLVHGFGTIHLPLLDQLESVSYDFKVRRTAPDSKDSRIVIVDIDEKSQAALGPWPWPRDRLARLVDTLFEHYRIGVLGFDMVFSEADLSSGLAQLESLAKGPLSQDSPFLTQFHKLRPTLDRDRIFAISLRDRPVILGFNFLQTAFSGLADMGKLPLPVITLREIGNDDVNSINAVGYLTNIGKIQDSASGAGFIDNPAVSQDGVVRRVPLLQNFNGALYQSLPLGIIRTILGDPPLTLGLSSSKDHNAKTGLEWISLGPHKITVDSQGAILIPFRGKQGSFPYFSAVDVMERGPEKQALDAAIVLVGVSSVGNARMLAITPVQKGFPSVEIHANIISGILDGTFKSLPGMSPWPDVLLLGAIGVIFSILLAWIPMSWRFVSAGFLIVLLFIVNIYLWQSWDLHLSLATPITLIVLLLLTDTFFEVFGISPKRDKLHVLYGRHVSRALMDEIIRTGRSLAASGEQREMTVITSTVKDFSKMAKNLSSKDLSQWLHGFLTPLTEVIHNHRGTLDHYHGESIVAFWGAPVEDLNHGRSA
ncbi:MAG TPA: CHASE2 domain-containing protein, partial [Magnetococcales bacterium]|nr:CHASE2 domain-containing protein [Magnetococcales bacterium]